MVISYNIYSRKILSRVQGSNLSWDQLELDGYNVTPKITESLSPIYHYTLLIGRTCLTKLEKKGERYTFDLAHHNPNSNAEILFNMTLSALCKCPVSRQWEMPYQYSRVYVMGVPELVVTHRTFGLYLVGVLVLPRC